MARTPMLCRPRRQGAHVSDATPVPTLGHGGQYGGRDPGFRQTIGAAQSWHPARKVPMAKDKIRVGIIGARLMVDSGGLTHPVQDLSTLKLNVFFQIPADFGKMPVAPQ
jgi:hypothetical protein